MNHTELDQLLSSAFRGGECKRRELRLSREDARFLADHYPVTVESLGGQWYRITF